MDKLSNSDELNATIVGQSQPNDEKDRQGENETCFADDEQQEEETMYATVPVPDEETLEAYRTPRFSFLGPPAESGDIGTLGGYRVLELLGEGGMGVVFRAEDPKLERQVALKAMKPEVAMVRSARERFVREAKATASIEHDNIVTIHQVGEDRSIPFIAMQFLRGESLDRRLQREGRVSQEEVLRIGRETAAGLSAAHKCGLIHRDIKPDNLWIEEESGRVKILDFGLVHVASEIDVGLTQTGTVLGTPRYMAPEQAAGQPVDRRCDLFSLGSVLYHMTTGSPAFDGTNITALLLAVVNEEPKPIAPICPDINPQVARLIEQLLKKDRELRPQSAANVVDTIKRIENGLPVDTPSDSTEPHSDSSASASRTHEPEAVLPQVQTSDPQSIVAKRSLPKSGLGGNGNLKTHVLIAAAGAVALFLLLGVIIITITYADGTKTTITAKEGNEISVEPSDSKGIKSIDVKSVESKPPTAKEIPPIQDAGKEDRQVQIAKELLATGALVVVGTEGKVTSLKPGDVVPAGAKIHQATLKGDSQVTRENLSKLQGIPSFKILTLADASPDEGTMMSIGDLNRLTNIWMSNINVPSGGMKSFENLKDLVMFYAGGTNFAPADFDALSKLPKLISMEIGGERLTDEGLVGFSRLGKLTGLEVKAAPNLTDKAFIEIGRLPNLESLLIVGAPKLSVDGIEAIARLETLRKCYIRDTPLTDLDIAPLMSHKNLKHLSIHGTEVTSQQIKILREGLPETTIKSDISEKE